MLLCSLSAWAEDPKLRGGNVLSCETYSFRAAIRAGKLDMSEVPAYYMEQGIKGVSFNDSFFKSFDDVYVDRVKAAVAQAGRVVTGFVMGGNLATLDDAKRKEDIETDKRLMRVAHRLGASLVRINTGGTGDEKADATTGIERAAAALRELLPLARELHLKIAIENHGGVSKKAAYIVRLIRATDPKRVGAAVDFNNFPAEIRYDEIATVAPYALTCHVKVNRVDARGEAADYDFPRVLGILKKNHYKGPLSIEYEGKGDPVEGVRSSRALILKYW